MKATMKKIRHTSKTVITLSLATALGIPAGAHADATATQAEVARTVGFVPDFMKAMPANLVPGLWQETRDFQMSSKTALSAKTKDLIGVGPSVSSASLPDLATYLDRTVKTGTFCSYEPM